MVTGAGAAQEGRRRAVPLSRQDLKARLRAAIGNWDCFAAPAALICYIDRDMGPPRPRPMSSASPSPDSCPRMSSFKASASRRRTSLPAHRRGDSVRDGRATRFHDVLLLLGYWIPAFVAVVVIDWLLCVRGRATINPARELIRRRDAVAAVTLFVLAYVAAIPFMNTRAQGADRRGTARCRHRLLRELPGGWHALRRLPAAAHPPLTPRGTTDFQPRTTDFQGSASTVLQRV